MIVIIILLIVLLFACVPFVPFFVKHIPDICYHAVLDCVHFFKDKKWKNYNVSGVYIYGGLFGCGKTLSIVEYAYRIYKQYDNVIFCSNVSLDGIPYVPFVYFEQLLEPTPEGKHIIYIVDECGSLMNSRNYKNNKISETEFVLCLNQIRHTDKTLLLASQRFSMCDKNFRQIAVEWVECSRTWRFIKHSFYDPWDLENCSNPKMIKPLRHSQYIFASNKIYKLYDTKEVVNNFCENYLAGTYNFIQIEATDNSTNDNYKVANVKRKYKKYKK